MQKPRVGGIIFTTPVLLYLPQAMNDRFNYELKLQIEGTLPKGHIYQLGKPGQVLQNAGIPDLPIELKAGRLEHKASENYKNKHQFDIADIKDLPKAINEPIAVFNSTKNDGAKIILTDLKDKKGNNFVAVIKMYKDALGKKNSMDINSIVSIYPKDNIAELKNWFKSGNKLVALHPPNHPSRLLENIKPRLWNTRFLIINIQKFQRKSKNSKLISKLSSIFQVL